MAATTSTLANELNDLLSEPIGAVKVRERSALERLLREADSRVVIFGAGSTGRRALPCLRAIGVEPVAISDNNERLWGTSIDGTLVLPPAEAAARFGSDALFLVCIWNDRHMFRDTRRQLEQLGVQRISTASPLYWRFSETFLPFMCQDLAHNIYEEASSVMRAAELWSDQDSRDTYLAQIKWRALGDWDGLTKTLAEKSYFATDLFDFSPTEIFVDCGAYDGDTFRDYLAAAGHRFARFHAIEADKGSLARLRAYTETLDPGIQDKIVIHECAVGAERCTLRFTNTGGVDSRLSDLGDTDVDCLPLDEIFSTAGATFIKMDIEGAEFDALQGARLTIQHHRPILSICLYHYQNDLWRLPLLIHDTAPDYRFYIRTYEGDGMQTVAYAVPKERARKPLA